MKFWLALGVLGFAVSAHADPAMVADDGDLGQVVLTAEKLDGCGTQRVAYLTRPLDPEEPKDTITFWGCWTVASNQVHVKYFAGNEARYERAAFTFEEVERVAIPRAAPPDEGPAESYGPST